MQAGAVSSGSTDGGQICLEDRVRTIEDDIDDESAAYQDSAINLDKAYKHWKSTKTRRNNLK